MSAHGPTAPGERRESGRRASHATLASLLARALRAAGRLGAFWMAARLFPAEEVGSFAFWLAAGTLAGVLGDLGLSEHLMRSGAAGGDGQPGLFRTALRLRLVGGGTIALLTWAVAAACRPSADAGAAGAFVFGAAVGLADFLAAARRARGRFALEAVESGLAAAGGLAGAALVTVLVPTLVAFEVALGFGTLTVVGLRLLALRSEVAAGAAPGAPAREVLTGSRWLWARSLVGWSFLDATTLLLAFVSSDAQVALFAGAARLVGLMTQPLIALNSVFTPALAHEAAAGAERFAAAVRRLNLIGLLATPAGVAACVLLGRLALAGFGSPYRAAEPALLLLALGFAVHSSLLNGVPLVVRGAERALLLATATGLLAAFLAVALTAPSGGAVAAAAGVTGGLVLAKGISAALYRRLHLPLGGWPQLALTASLCGWFAAAWLLPGLARDAVLLSGGIAGGLAALALLHRTRIFAAE
jgi:O-antigen/teichoic acid export membrane protein